VIGSGERQRRSKVQLSRIVRLQVHHRAVADLDIPADLLDLQQAFYAADKKCDRIGNGLPKAAEVLKGAEIDWEPPPAGCWLVAAALAARSASARSRPRTGQTSVPPQLRPKT
jgi:hypothetical protein